MKDYYQIIGKLVNYKTEVEWFEFKENWFEPHGIGEYISALANAAAFARKDSGYLVWGVNDSTHEITGTKFDYRRDVKGEPLEHYLARKVTPDIAFDFKEIDFDGKRIVILEVPKSKNVPTSFDGIRYVRIGSIKVNLTKYPEREAKLFEILRNDEKTITNIESEYQDLTFEKLFTYYAGKGISLKNETFKKNLGLLTKDGEFNLLAQLLSDNSHIPIRVSVFSGDTKASNLFSVKEFGNTCLLLSLDKVLEYSDVINIIQADERNRVVTRKDQALFDMVAYREAVINAFVHNKWVDENAPMITVYNNRVEILSRGTLDPKQTIEGFYLGESIPINQKLSDIFLQLHISERSGRGVPKVISVYGKDVFDFRENSIVVNIPFNWIDKTEVSESKIRKTDARKNGKYIDSKGLSDKRIRILYEMRNNPNITQKQLSAILGVTRTAVQKHIKYLRDNDYLERVGSNKNGYWLVKD